MWHSSPTVPNRFQSGIEYTYTYLAWVAKGVALGLFRLLTKEGVCVGLERAEHWGTAWT